MGEKLEQALFEVGEECGDVVRVFKSDGKFFMQVIYPTNIKFNTTEIEISRVTYCALLVDTKLAESLL